MTAAADRHLLFGLLALQNGIIRQVQLVAAFQAWTLDKSKGLADHLEGRGDLTGAKRALLEALAKAHLDAHGGDVEQSLAAVPAGRSTKESLARIADPEINATLGHVGSNQRSTHDDNDPDRTGTYSVGSATSDGQRFRVLRPHARGGLGAVFVALDGELNREVALKQILEPHADDPVSRQRFLIEAEITGGLEHPGIVPVYGLGTYDGGRPYYAMRFIKGDSLKEAIERFHADATLKADPGPRSLELRKLLRRFQDVCNAIDYAHSRGVLHRDIKPGNIIVGKHGETLVVDWGLAKPLGRIEPGQESGERTLVPSSASGSAETLSGSAIGTPAYMSPEQACGDLDRLGPRSDVFSLGSTLYCLLTGRPPFEGDDIGEVLRKVQRGEFTPPRQLDPALDKALEAVCKKAMAIRPEDRYASCRALADDIERWAADEPVTAWAEPFSRKLLRWLTRHRTSVTGAAAALLAGVVGLTAVLAVQAQANGRLERANRDLASANNLVTKANADLMSANEREKQRFNLAMVAIRLFHGEVGDDLVLKADQFKPLRDKLLRGAADFYGKLEELLKGQADRASRAAMGNAYFSLGDLTSKIGDKPAALAAHRNGLAVRRELAAALADDAEARSDVAKSLSSTAALLHQTGESAEALARFEEARDLLEGIPHSGAGSDARRSLLVQANLGIGYVLAEIGKTDAAMAANQRSLELLTRLADENPANIEFRDLMAANHNNIGALLMSLSKTHEALESYRQALAINQKLVKENPAVTEFRDNLATNQNNIGFLFSRNGKPAEALESFQQALLIQQKLADENPAVTDRQSRLANTHNNIGTSQRDVGKPAEALESLRRGLAIRQKLVADNPAVTDFRLYVADSHNGIAIVQSDCGKPVEAMESYRRALAIYRKLADDNPAVALYRARMANNHTCHGLMLVRIGRLAEAIAEFSLEQAIWTRLVQENPTVPKYRDSLANGLNNTAAALLRLKRPAEARALCERAISLRQALMKDDPENLVYRNGLGESHLRSGEARRDEGDTAGAVSDWRQSDALLEGVGELTPEYAFLHACCRSSLSWAAGRPGSGVPAVDAEANAAKAVALLRHAAAKGFSNLATYRNEPALDPLRSRADFRLLMMDLAFPAEPFAQ